MLKQEPNIKKVNWKIIYFLSLMFFVSCNGNNQKREHIPVSIDNISILTSRGGREVVWEERDKIIPDSLSDEVYLLDLDTLGNLKVSYGFGKVTETEINIKYIEKSDSTKILQDKLSVIIDLAKNIYSQEEYHTKQDILDSWIVKLMINEKTFTYYLGESLDTLNMDYLDIVDEIVVKSPIKVKYYR